MRARARGRCGLSFIVPSDHGSGMDLSSLSTIKIKNLPGQPPPPLPATAGLRPNGAYVEPEAESFTEIMIYARTVIFVHLSERGT